MVVMTQGRVRVKGAHERAGFVNVGLPGIVSP